MDLAAGDRVCSRVQGEYYGIPGTVLRVSPAQFSPGYFLDYLIKLDDGRSVAINSDYLRPVTDEDESRFKERQLARQERDRRVRERQERIAARRLESERVRAEQKERERAQQMQDLNDRLQRELDVEQIETSRAIARKTLKGSDR